MSNRLFNPNPQYLKNDGTPNSGGTLEFFVTGTSTPATTYYTSANTLGTENANPQPLDDAGRTTEPVFLSSTVTYKVTMKDSAGNVIWTRDPVVDPAANVSAAVQVYPGNPNGNVAGNQGTAGGSGASMIWDITNNLLYICTTTGDDTSAVWTSTTASLVGAVLLTGVITPATISANQNDYEPAGGDAASVWRLYLSANASITGLGGGVAGRILILPNVSTSNYLSLVGEVNSTASAAANRMAIQGTVNIGPHQTAILQYDGISSRWRLVGTTGFHGRTVLVDGANIAWDLSTGIDFQVTLAGNRTLSAFTKATPGQKGTLRVVQDGTGSRSLDLTNAVYDFPGGFTESPAQGANDETFYEYEVIAANTAMRLRRLGGTTIGGPKGDLLDAKTASASATIDFVLTKWLQLYDRFEIEFEDVRPATDAVGWYFRTSTNGGSSYDAGASDYTYAVMGLRPGANLDFTSSGEAQIRLVDNSTMSNAAGEGASGTITIFNPRAAQPCRLAFDTTFISAGGDISHYRGGGMRVAAADVDAVRFVMSTGNTTSGGFRLYGSRK